MIIKGQSEKFEETSAKLLMAPPDTLEAPPDQVQPVSTSGPMEDPHLESQQNFMHESQGTALQISSVCSSESLDNPPQENQQQQVLQMGSHSQEPTSLPMTEEVIQMTACEQTVLPSSGTFEHMALSPPQNQGDNPAATVLALAAANGSSQNMVTVMEGTVSLLGHLETHPKGERTADKCIVRRKRRSISQDVDGHDGDGSNEKQCITRWKDAWISQLIHTRGGMQHIFSCPKKRRRLDLWQEVTNTLVRTCAGFDKDTEACRKKWRRIYKEYKDDKLSKNSGMDGLERCRFYNLIDAYFGDRVNGVCTKGLTDDVDCSRQSAATPIDDGVQPMNVTGPNTITHSPAVFIPQIIEKACMIENIEKTSINRDHHKLENPPPGSIHSLLCELVSIGKEMLQITKDSEKEKLDVLHSLKDTLGEIAKKLKT